MNQAKVDAVVVVAVFKLQHLSAYLPIRNDSLNHIIVAKTPPGRPNRRQTGKNYFQMFCADDGAMVTRFQLCFD